MAEIIKRISLEATFDTYEIGDLLFFTTSDASESHLRSKASLYNKKTGKTMKVKLTDKPGLMKVYRES